MHRRAKKTKRFRRPAAGPLFRLPGNFIKKALPGRSGAVYPEVLLWAAVMELVTILFVWRYETSPGLAAAALPIVIPPAVILVWLDRSLPGFYRRIRVRIGGGQTVFFTFFASLLGGILLFSLLLGYPMALVFGWLDLDSLAPHYERWTANFGIAAALLVWMRCALLKPRRPA